MGTPDRERCDESKAVYSVPTKPAQEGLNSVEYGDEPRVQQQVVPLSAAASISPAPAPAPRAPEAASPQTLKPLYSVRLTLSTPWWRASLSSEKPRRTHYPADHQKQV
jgi:hypothetical protein